MAKLHVLLRIGFSEYWLPDDTGLAGVLKALSKGILVNDEGYGRERQLRPLDDECHTRVRVEYTALKPVVPKPAPESGRIGRERPAKQRQLLLEHKR